MKSKQLTHDSSEKIPLKNFDFEYTNTPSRKKICLCCTRKIPSNQLANRKIISNKPDYKLCNNSISTAKYNLITFLPKNIFQQFTKVANLYFLIIGIMQTIPDISVSNGRPDTFLPLFFIVLVTMIKDAYEDIKRHRSDREENMKKCKYYDNKEQKLKVKQWQDLRVGEIIKINRDEYFPADCLIIGCSNPKGLCYIETKNLDGETNLKHKLLPKDLKVFQHLEDSKDEINFNSKIIFSYEKPNPFLNTFIGNTETIDGKVVPVDMSNFILRGCSLRNTDWIYGLVAYTGHDTKIMLNSVKARTKRSKLETQMSYQIVYVFLFQIGICLFTAAYYTIWFDSNKDILPYLALDSKSKEWNMTYNYFTRFGNWIIIFSNFVPISLIVTLEMVKFFQGILMSRDPKLYHKPTKTPITVQSSNLNEELGQIEYIFSDKTGTLTCNYMEFRKIVVSGIPYGIDQSLRNIEKFPKVTNVNFRDANFINILNSPQHPEHSNLKNYLKVLGICHTIMVETRNNELTYDAASPDELALVNFARFCGVEFRGTDESNNMIIADKQKISKFTQLQVLEFSSKRKRNSVIVRDESGQLYLYCKGADNIIRDRLSNQSRSSIELTKTLNELEKFGSEGLRTLLIAQKKLTQEQYDKWMAKYIDAQIAQQNRDERIEEAQELIEKDLELIGATAIEDKLQDEVGDTIATLKQAGIKVWVLTGDKKETAINIGYSCALLDNEMEKLSVDGEKFTDVQNELAKAYEELQSRIRIKPTRFALIISGPALIHGMEPVLSKKIMDIANYCEAVICCRVSPKQKADIVTLVRKTKPTVSTLAIGDGANDVNMITAAHVGIGIRGVEGQQAARASDYAIGEFKFLKRLVLVHGRESYRKNAVLILYNFFKNVLLVLPIFWVGFNMVFSGQRLYDSWLYAFFNIFYSSWPIIIYALFDNEYPEKELLTFPDLYEPGIKSERFNAKKFWLWFFDAAYQAVIIGYFSLYSLEWTSPSKEGRVFDIWSSGSMMLGMCVVIVNLKIIVISNIDSWASTLISILSMGAYILCFFILNLLEISDVFQLFDDIWYVAYFYLGNFLIIASTTYFDLAIWRTFVLKRNYKDMIRHKLLAQRKPMLQFKEDAQNGLIARTPMENDIEIRLNEEKPNIAYPLEDFSSYRHTGYAFSIEDKKSKFDYHFNPQN